MTDANEAFGNAGKKEKVLVSTETQKLNIMYSAAHTSCISHDH